MKKLIILYFLLSPFWAFSQFTELTHQAGITKKVLSDSVANNTADSLALTAFRSTGARINTLRSTTINSGMHTAQSAAIGSLNVSGNTVVNSISGNSSVFNTSRVNNAANANPVFATGNGSLTSASVVQYHALPAVAFFPEQVSPLETASILQQGGIRKFSFQGTVESQSITNSHLYSLVAPLVLPLNNSNSNILITEETKMCVWDNENRDLVALFYQVNSSQNQPILQVEPKMLIRSQGNLAEYRCFNLKDSGYGNPFNLDQSDNSYYISVFPVSSQSPTEDIFNNPQQFYLPWQIDNPALRLVHVITAYQY